MLSLRKIPSRFWLNFIFVTIAFCLSVAGVSAGPVVYPVKVSPNHRYLVDQNDKPFLITGDSPQSLMVNLTAAQADSFFSNRQAHGFNTMWINLVCDTYTGGRHDGSTYDGMFPFTGYLSGGTDLAHFDLSKPNEAYFARCDQIMKLAAKYNLLVFLDPIEPGGFMTNMLINGRAACFAYGKFVGERYKGFDNIVWLNGNDFQTWHKLADDADATAVAKGIQAVDSRHIHTIELDYNVSLSTDDPAWAALASLNAAYTYYPTYAEVLKGYNYAPTMPVFMIEATYEFEDNMQAHMSTPHTLRREEYWSDLSGATGLIYGNHYTWTFAQGWKTHLETPGAAQIMFFKSFFESRPWQDLIPDQDHTTLTAGDGTFSSKGTIDANDYATAARTPDGHVVIAYAPTIRPMTIDMTKLSGSATARWFDPSNGAYTSIDGSPFANTGSRIFTASGPNHDSDGDWVLVLEAN
jgi:hypothetical protein